MPIASASNFSLATLYVLHSAREWKRVISMGSPTAVWKETSSLISVNRSYEQMMQAGLNSCCGIAIHLLYNMPFN